MTDTKNPAAAAPGEKVQALRDGDSKARRLAYLTVLTPAVGFVAALWYSIQFGFKQQDMILLGAMYFLTSFGVEGGLHRFFSHRAFKAGPVVTAVIGILGCMAAQGPILFWAATHRMHHVFTDQDGDPHSPRVLSPGLRGRIKALWHGHVGWLFTVKRSNWSTYVPDLFGSKLVLFVNQHYLIWVLLGLALPTAIGAALSGIEGTIGGLLWGGAGPDIPARPSDLGGQFDRPYLRQAAQPDARHQRQHRLAGAGVGRRRLAQQPSRQPGAGAQRFPFLADRHHRLGDPAVRTARPGLGYPPTPERRSAGPETFQ
ncbi:fatty acid desaturase [Collimonas fungivorans]|uniref:Delta-9 fatty acid desaturase n=1 Tax=Collimonas fungivorans (strain Ter331) TaxID=1005048 RepID=G0A7V4_COLFT|nr:acyl-CoA desaturase [Collimonas fungivorans]AEK59865.1 Delta-9 fatty acid desaturase [Collimonas fungivorans Ter331]